jgi:glyoxylase-like metal-dependent hydrolase (beta-lactamase superfamily II)
VRERGSYFSKLVPALPNAHHRLQDGMRIAIGPHSWRCIAGFGHAPEHISLYCADLGVLISGDMLLPKISTNVSVPDWEPEANPLAAYLHSIALLRDLPPATLVLPSHGHPFGGAAASSGQGGIHTRVAELHQHHDDRLAETMQACQHAPTSAAALLPVLFKRALDLHQTTFALGEALAHLNYLWLAGEVRRERSADGVWQFKA